MKDYELSVLFHPDLEMNIDPALDKVRKIIEGSGGKITSEEPDGKKKLAYQIKGQDFAVYYYFVVDLPAEAPAKISSVLNITDEVLRYMLTRVDERKAKLAARRAERASQEEATEAEAEENKAVEE